MEVSASDKTAQLEVVTPTDTAIDNGSAPTIGVAFESYLRSILQPDAANQISEEELFAGLIQERISNAKGEEAGEQYESLLDSRKTALTRGDGYVNVEKAANQALNDMIDKGILSQEEGAQIKADAFAAAQLDDNLNALYDGRGSADDPTVAVAEMESALTLARAKMLGDVSEVEVSNQDASSTAVSDTSTQLSSDSTLTEATQTVSTDDLGRIVPNGNEVDGDEGFVFKPHSDHEGKLVILLPAELANQVASVLLEDENGNVVEHGSSSGHANGGREHFRFTKPGEDYPQNLTVRITENNQATHTYFIPDPAQRYD